MQGTFLGLINYWKNEFDTRMDIPKDFKSRLSYQTAIESFRITGMRLGTICKVLSLMTITCSKPPIKTAERRDLNHPVFNLNPQLCRRSYKSHSINPVICNAFFSRLAHYFVWLLAWNWGSVNKKVTKPISVHLLINFVWSYNCWQLLGSTSKNH